jgi:hypothetical protein
LGQVFQGFRWQKIKLERGASIGELLKIKGIVWQSASIGHESTHGTGGIEATLRNLIISCFLCLLHWLPGAIKWRG